MLVAAGCASAGGREDTAEATTVRLGVFPNVTHAPGLIGIEVGLFKKALGQGVDLEVHYFNAGGEAAQALMAGSIDITYIGPNPAINAFAQSEGKAVRIISGSTSGGAFFVVRKDIQGTGDLHGGTVASPLPIGNTQDVALRSWLGWHGLRTDSGGRGGQVAVNSMANADVLRAFQQGQLDGAWVPEPWASRLVREGGGKVLVDERDLWPDRRYVTTHLLAATEFLAKSPGRVRSLLEGHLDALELIEKHPAVARRLVGDGIAKGTNMRLPQDLIDASWRNLEFTVDPIKSSLATSAEHAAAVGLLEPVELDGIYDLEILNELLRQRGQQEVAE